MSARVAGLLLLCAAVCRTAEDDLQQILVPTQNERCLDQGDATGTFGGQCRLSEEFESDAHRCELLQLVRCPGGDKYVAEYSHCVVSPELVHFTCQAGRWVMSAQDDYVHERKKRHLAPGAVKVVGSALKETANYLALHPQPGGGLFIVAEAVVGGVVIAAAAVIDVVTDIFKCIFFFGCGGTRTVYVTNKPPVIKGCPASYTEVTANMGTTTHTVRWDQPTASDPEGKAVTVDKIQGPGPGTTFKEGDTEIGYRARDSGGATAFCWFTVSVTVNRCLPRPRYIEYGIYSCTGGVEENLYGSVCTYSCKDGYDIGANNSNSMTCQQDKTWSNSVPDCSPVSCGDPGSMTSGSYDCPGGHVYPKLCYVTCDAGFRQPSGAPFIRCTETGQWTSTTACRDAEAPKFPKGCPLNMNLDSGPLKQPVPVTWDDPAVSDTSTYILTSSLTKGSALPPGFHAIRLTATDAEGLSTSCNFVVTVTEKICESFQKPNHSELSCPHGHVEGARCTVTCDPGYDLGERTTLTCLHTTQWDVSVPSCSAVNCGPPPSVEFGGFVGGGFQYPAVLTLTCDATFDIEGDRYLRCQDNGEWGQSGRCVDKQGPTFPQGCTESFEMFAASLGQPTHANWNPPATDDNSRQTVTLVSSKAPGSPFSPGVTSVTYTATDPSGNAGTCSFSVTVTTLTCPSLTQNASTYLSYTCPDKNVFGAVCTPRCSNGFPRQGADNVTCQRNDSTSPPTMDWGWDAPATRPECIESKCPNLTAPMNGALGCYQGNFAKECLMSCQAQWDVPSSTDGRFVCPNDLGVWIPANVPDCISFVHPGQLRMMSDLYYFTGDCSASTQDIQHKFMDRINTSQWSSGCATTSSCVAENIKVTCGQMSARRRKRSDRSHFVRISFQLAMEYEDGSNSPEDAYKHFQAMQDVIFKKLSDEVVSGHFNIDNLTADRHSVSYPTLTADCPPGTLFRNTAATTRLSCVGCYRGHFLAPGSDSCQQCPVGSYTPLDTATACTPCPAGWSTPGAASTNRSDCQEMCRAGQFSDDGFVPCQPCPPGQYQSRERGVTCDLCPASTWTNGSATGLHQCVPADAHLINGTSLIARAPASLTALSLTSFFRLGDRGAVNVTFTFADNSQDPISVYLYTSLSNTSTNVPRNSNTSVSTLVEAKKWSSLVLTSDASGGGTSVTLKKVAILTRAQPRSTPPSSSSSPTPALPAVQVTVTPMEGKVVVSGLFGAEDTVNASGPGQSGADCNGDVSSNLLTWSLSPAALQSPSLCDAVDACLSSPCSSHGECDDLRDGYLCRCRDGWSGPTCHLPPGACYLHQCQNAATCLEPQSAGSNYSCLCAEGYSGQRCDLVKVNGELGEWSSWSNCSAICEGQQHRQRLCDNPAPLNGGDICAGALAQTQLCGESRCPVDGGWRAWAPWSPCSASCDGGERVRQRLCDNPAPQYGGEQCPGGAEDREACNNVECPVDGKWGLWSTWSNCSVTCGGGGTKSRDRSCDRPAPANGGAPCVGSTDETEACGEAKCPECSLLRRTASILLTCDDWMTPTPDPVTCNVTCAPGHAAPSPFPQYQCGSKTAYLWNDQLTPASPVILPVCSAPTSVTGGSMTQTVPMKAGCDVNTNDVIRGVRQNMQQLPCVASGCQTTVSTTCADDGNASGAGRRRRSVGHLNVVLNLKVDFGEATPLNSSDPTAAQKYVDAFNLAERSAALLVQNKNNNSGSLFTVSVNGKVIGPEMTSATYSTSLSCPAGSTAVSYYCVPCLPGTKEEGGDCVLCPVGQYQDASGSTTCNACPAGLAYDLPGASDVRQCVFSYGSSHTPSKDADSHVGVIVGGVLGVVALLLLAGLVAAVVIVKHKKENQTGHPYKRPMTAKVHPSRPGSAASVAMFPNFAYGPAEPSLPPPSYTRGAWIPESQPAPAASED